MLDDAVFDEIIEELGHKRALAKALDEKLKRAQRLSHTTPGGLLRFIEDHWHILEPAREFVKGWALEAMCQHLEAVSSGDITRLLINVPPGSMKSLLVNVFFPAWEWGPMGKPHLKYLAFSYASHLTERDNQKMMDLILSREYQRLYGHVFALREKGKIKTSNSKTGSKFASSVLGTSTGERGDRVLFDDPHNVAQGESSAITLNTVRFFRESMSNRLNDIAKSAIIVIMQRVNEADVSGEIIANKLGYVHLMIPLEYEPGRRCITVVKGKRFWSDPRTVEGASFFPERFGPVEIGECLLMGDFVYCTPGESPVLMADLTMKPIRDVREGDEVVGFSGVAGKSDKGKYGQRRTLPARVGNITRSVRPVMRVTLDSGRVIRCTEDHQWFTRRSGKGSHAEYLPAKVGRDLWRVCDPELPALTDQVDIRDAGWLGGFFDAEGSVSVMKKQGGYEPSSLVSFYQGAGRNLPLCENLERILNKFGFSWGCFEREPYPHQTHNMRHYYLTRPRGHGIASTQRFLHIAQPIKWRDRIISGAYGSNFLIGKERVVSIEADGEEEVFGLTTETGNYVVWGLASKNCGQYQQRPEPRGGGLFKRDYWEQYTKTTAPKLDFVLASLDSAFTDKTRNDPSAFSVWGCFKDEHGNRSALLMHAWRKHLLLHGKCRKRRKGESLGLYKDDTQDTWGLVQWVAYELERLKANRLLIENKASGIDVSNEMERLFGKKKWVSELVDPAGLDKWARATRTQPMFSEGLIYAPGLVKDDSFKLMKHAQLVVDEMALFDKGKYDDLTDTATQAVWWLRQNGYLVLNEEYRAIAIEKAKNFQQARKLYPC